MAIPSVPNSNAGSGTIPGEAKTIPTIAVNTISKLTLGFVSERYSRHPGWDSAVISESWGTIAKQRYRCICISLSMGIILWFR